MPTSDSLENFASNSLEDRTQTMSFSTLFEVKRPHLEDGRALTIVGSEAGVSYRTAQRWIALAAIFTKGPGQIREKLHGAIARGQASDSTVFFG